MAKTCFERFDQIIKIVRVMAVMVGVDVFDRNYKMGVMTWMIIMVLNVYFCCTFYTIHLGLTKEGDWKVILQTLSFSGSGCQSYVKLVLFIYKRWVVISMYETLSNIYKKYQMESDYLKVLTYRTHLATKILKIVLVLHIVILATLVLYPVILGHFRNERLFIMHFFVPGIDPKTHSGFLMHNIYYSFMLFMGTFGNFAGDIVIITFIMNIPLLKDILKIKFEKLNLITLSTRNPKQTMPVLKEILEWHQNYNKFVQQVEEVFYGIIFVQVSTSVLSICCTLFSIVIGSWPAAFSYLMYSSMMLYCYCGLGHLVEISNDELIDVIYCDCLWYELSVPEQKLILLMTRKSQKPTTLTVGQVMPLSMSTALQLTKAIYSYMMMLVNFLEMDNL